nr:TolC family protein [Allomuricauda sp.]
MKKLILILFLMSFTVGISQSKSSYNIGILLDNRNEKIDSLLLRLENEIEAVVGEDASIDFSDRNVLNNNYNLELAERNYNEMVAGQVDIIIAFGIVNNQFISKLDVHKKPTIVFGAVNSDLIQVDLESKTSGIHNFTYLIESKSYKEDLDMLYEMSDFNNVGIALEQELVDILPFKRIFDKVIGDLNSTYTVIPYKTVADITSNLNDVDALYLAGGFLFSKEEAKSLAQALIDKKMPSFTLNGEQQVEEGIMATFQSSDNLDQFLRRISLTVESYINGMPLSEMPVFIDFSQELSINFNTVDLIDLPIKYSLMGDAHFVGDFKSVPSDKKYTLLELIDKVLENNLSLRSDQKEVALSQQDVKTAKSDYMPNLTASGSGTYVDPDAAANSLGQSPEFSTTGNITLNQTIFSESANANITIQKKLRQAQQENFNAAQLDAIFNASSSYFTALILNANMQIQVSNLELTKKNLQIAEQNYNAGESGKSDMLRFRSEMAQNRLALIQAVNSLEQGYVSLNQLINNDVGARIGVEEVELSDGVFERYNYNEFSDLLDNPHIREHFIAFLIEEAKKNAPELRSINYNMEAIERNIKLSGLGRFLPTVGIQGQYNRTFNRSGAGSEPLEGFTLLDDNYNVGLNISLPLINQNRNNINRQTAVIQKEQLQINKENTELAMAANVRNAVLNVINEMANMELSKVSEEAAKESLELTQSGYSNGAVNIIQLLDAQNNYLSAQLSKTTAVYNFLINALQLERYLGYYFMLNSDEENDSFRQRFIEFLNNKN